MAHAELSWRGGALLLGLALAAAIAPAGARNHAVQQGWRDSFPVDKADLMDHGRNAFFVLEPGYRLHFANGDEKLVITVLDETKPIDGVRTRVVEERASKGG